MEREKVELARMHLATAERLFDGSLDGVDRIWRARADLEDAESRYRAEALAGMESLAAEMCSFVSRTNELFAVRQAAAKFVTEESWPDITGWTWPVQIIQSGWANGSFEGALGEWRANPHYFPPEILAQIAQAANGARFRRRHPEVGDGSDMPELTAGWLSNCRVRGSAVVGTVHLLRSEGQKGGVRSMLLAAREAGKLDLFGVSILASFEFETRKIDGKTGAVATSLKRLFGIDLCAVPGAGGKFLSAGPN